MALTNKFHIRRFQKNEIILYEEDTNEYMYVILGGKVKVTQVSEDGKETILSLHRVGEFFGEMSLIDGKTVPATVTATDKTLTAIISRKDFYELIYGQNKVLDNLLEILCARLRKSWEIIQLLNFNNASQRLRMLFYLLSTEYGRETPEGIVLDLKLTHRDIANMAGVTRETVTRVLDKWQKEKEITVQKNKLICMRRGFIQEDLKL
jgi:CRP/FNR family transcriptional regulator